MGSRGASSKSSTNYTLDKVLVSRANSMSVLDAGDTINKTFERNVEEIKSFAISDTEKKKAIKEQKELAEKALETTIKYPNAFATGRANAGKSVLTGADKIAKSQHALEISMNKIRKNNENTIKATQKASRAKIIQKALKNGDLSVVIDGEKWTRKSTRSKSFVRSY